MAGTSRKVKVAMVMGNSLNILFPPRKEFFVHAEA